jgi:prepilin-type N-terminal cleavage/methylation domain-containing protein
VKSRRGFTLLELLVVIGVIAVLAALGITVASGIRSRAERVQCMTNLRGLYVAAESYLQQNGSWPQIPMADESETADEDYASAWIAALAPFGATQKTWICPTMQRGMHSPDLSKPENVRVDYIASNFDDKPTTPHQWPGQPWFIEAGNGHGNGALIVFTDGTIKELNAFTAQAAPAPSGSP